MSHQATIWRALENSLGREKTAYIRQAPLYVVVRNKYAQEHGVDLGDKFSLGDAVGAIGISWRKKQGSHRSIRDGLKALDAALPRESTKTATENTPQMYPVGASTFQKIAAAQKVRMLIDFAENTGVRGVEKLAAVREAVDCDVIESIKKEASLLTDVLANPAVRNVGKGLGIGTGVAVPAYIAGSALSDDITADARDRALQTALGVGTIGLGVYGLGRGVDHFVDQTAADKNYARMQDNANHNMDLQRRAYEDKKRIDEKYASAASTAVEDFRTAAYVDALLDTVPNTEKIASIRALNREFAVNLLCDAQEKTANIYGIQYEEDIPHSQQLLYRIINGAFPGAALGAGLGAYGSAMSGGNIDPLLASLVGAGVGGLAGSFMVSPQEKRLMDALGTPDALIALFQRLKASGEAPENVDEILAYLQKKLQQQGGTELDPNDIEIRSAGGMSQLEALQQMSALMGATNGDDSPDSQAK